MKTLPFGILILSLNLVAPAASWAQAQPVRMIIETNQPHLPKIAQVTASRLATACGGSTETYMTGPENKILECLDKNYRTALDKLKSKPELVEEIKKAGRLYGIKPSLVAAAILGEHTLNNQMASKLQTIVIQNGWTASQIEKDVAKQVESQHAAECNRSPNIKTDYMRWICINDQIVRTEDPTNWDKNPDLHTTNKVQKFFGSKFGSSYGIAQLRPIRILMVADFVNRISHVPLQTYQNMGEVFKTTANPYRSIHFVAANIATSIQIYKEYAGFDISQSHGLTATLYNLGNEFKKALEITDRLKKNPSEIPQMNYYGWYMNHVKKSLIENFDQ